jgi:co-chaperonin GroES (HSP10)
MNYTEDQLRSPLKATHDYVVVRRLPQSGDSQIITPQGADTGKFDAVVVSVGPGRVTDQVGPDGELLKNKPLVKVGDKVMLNPNAFHAFKLFGHEFAIVNHFQIFAVVDDEQHQWFEANPIQHNLISANPGLQALLDKAAKSGKKPRNN